MFMEMLQRWIENIDLVAMRMKAILLDMHYKYAYFQQWASSRLLLMVIQAQLNY